MRLFSKKAIFTKDHPEYADYAIGDYTYGKPQVLSWGDSTLHIGKYCSIAENVTIFLGGNHRIDWVTTYPFSSIFPEARHFKGHPATKGDVVIGNDVWIGRSATILSGLKIGNGAVIGAGSMVTKDVPDYGIVAGNPAKLVKMRFDDDTIQALNRIGWWNWPHDHIMQTLPLMLNGDIAAFIRQASKID